MAKKIAATELNVARVDQLVKEKDTFQVVGVKDISEVVSLLEGRIEQAGHSCRVYTEYRAAALAGEALLGGVGVIAGIGILAHRLFTLNPDFEIGKNKLNSSVTVTYTGK